MAITDGGNAELSGEKTAVAIFAGGCFWCMEALFKSLDGVEDVVSGYTGGHVPRPTYVEVSTGTTGHYEAIRVCYDPSRISYERLLEVFWRHIDPTDADGQFYDRGSQYRTAIFYLNDHQRILAEESRRALEEAGIFEGSIATLIRPAGRFYAAEEPHQDYSRKNPVHYQWYSVASGRDGFVRRAWEGHDDFSFFPR